MAIVTKKNVGRPLLLMHLFFEYYSSNNKILIQLSKVVGPII